MNTLESTDRNDCRVQRDLEHEAHEVCEEARRLEADTREAEREMKTGAGLHLHDVLPDVSGLYEILHAAETLVAVAEGCLSGAAAKDKLASTSALREIADSATKIIESATKIKDDVKQLRKAPAADHIDPPEED